jgi:hypothetical protein
MIVEGIDISRGFLFKAQFRAPDVPTIGTATTLSNTTANITFTAPTFIGDSLLIGYTAIAYPGGIRTEGLDPNTSNITLTGLTPGTRYTVSVTANNSDAPSANSTSTNLITTFDVPGPPTGQLFRLSSTTANVYYTLSSNIGNTALIAVVAQSNTGIVLGKSHSVTGGSAGNLTLIGLSANTSYSVQLAANNISGLGSLLSFAPIYTSVFPDAPAISYVAATSDTTANIVFTAPEYVGSGITSYTGNANGISYATVSQAGSGNIIISGLSSNITYSFNAVATSSQGNSIPSSSVTASTWGATVTPAASSINEGSTLTINVATTNIPNGTTLYWITNNITTSNVDFVSSVVSGSFTVTANTGSFTVSPAAGGGVAEGAETFSVSIKSSNTGGTTMVTSSAITINDTSFISASFSLVPSSINEGSPGTFNVSTSSVADATTLYYTVETNAGDFATASGSFTVTSNAGSFTVTPTADATTEGAETFTVSIRTGSITGPVLVTSSSVTINDTSLTPGISFSSVPVSINEGSPGTFSVSTTGYADATTLFYTVQTNAGDFATSSGSFTITSNAGSFTLTPTADVTTEGAEAFTVAVRTGSTSGPIIATSDSVTINDTSTTVTTFAVQYLVIAGGGGGPIGGNDSGGGGAGGYRTNVPGATSGGNTPAEPAMNLTIGTSYPVTIGTGGPSAVPTTGGTPSTFDTIVSTGGGNGGRPAAVPANPGGSGGGGGSPTLTGGTGTPGQGFAGGSGTGDGGGGGGAGGTGFPGSSVGNLGRGGVGLDSSITGSPVFRGGGGGGGVDSIPAGVAGSGGGGNGGTPASNTGISGTANTGGGGGGSSGPGGAGSTGGPGVVILRYPNARTITVAGSLAAGALNVAAPNSEKYTQLNSGSGTVSWS